MVLGFGTDGVRGVANVELTPEFALALGRAVARVVVLPSASAGRPRCLVGRDTRRSGAFLAGALAAGLASEGVDVVDLGVIPTPGVAGLAAAYGVAGAMISASHNPFADNGIKVFGVGGHKLGDDMEARLEADLVAVVAGSHPSPVPGGADVGAVGPDPEGLGWYRRQLLAGLEGRRLDGVRVVVDCAHGAAVVTAPEVLGAAGADVVEVIGASPDGVNINAGCGSTAPQALAAAVVSHGADAGLAFDGDADRVIAVDGTGSVVDGDRLLALFATDLVRRGRLADRTVVVTVMTNLGFHHAMKAAGVTVHQTPVGDRNVVAALDRHRWSLGGEQSGHLIFRDLATTGDGVLSGLLLLDLMVRTAAPLAGMAAAVMDRLPQVLVNVPVGDRRGLTGAEAVWTEVRAVERDLGERGRVLLRPSGTEALVRVMVEAPTDDEAHAAATRISSAVSAALG